MVLLVCLIVGLMMFTGWRVGKWLKSIAEKHFIELEKIDQELKQYVNEQKEKNGD